MRVAKQWVGEGKTTGDGEHLEVEHKQTEEIYRVQKQRHGRSKPPLLTIFASACGSGRIIDFGKKNVEAGQLNLRTTVLHADRPPEPPGWPRDQDEQRTHTHTRACVAY